MGRTYCIGTIEDTEQGPELVIRVPWDVDALAENLRNCDATKKSVTLINGDIVRDVSTRGQTIDLYVQIADWRVQLRGGVNIYVSRPDGAGRQNSTLQKLSAAEQREIAAEQTRWIELPTALLSPNGSIFRKQGERILKDTLSDLMLGGFTLMPDTSALPEPTAE